MGSDFLVDGCRHYTHQTGIISKDMSSGKQMQIHGHSHIINTAVVNLLFSQYIHDFICGISLLDTGKCVNDEKK